MSAEKKINNFVVKAYKISYNSKGQLKKQQQNIYKNK